MEHTWYTGADCTCTYSDGLCWVCRNIVDGGLGACKVCGGFEGSLTTDCCGRKLTSEEIEDIYAGKLDFKSTRWEYNFNQPEEKEEVKMEQGKQASTSILVRDKSDPSKQMQVIINFETRELGVVHSKGLELLVIETAVIDDVPLSFKVPAKG